MLFLKEKQLADPPPKTSFLGGGRLAKNAGITVKTLKNVPYRGL